MDLIGRDWSARTMIVPLSQASFRIRILNPSA